MKFYFPKQCVFFADVGYYEQEKIVWEKLADVSGDNAFCDAAFRVQGYLAHKKQAPPRTLH